MNWPVPPQPNGWVRTVYGNMEAYGPPCYVCGKAATVQELHGDIVLHWACPEHARPMNPIDAGVRFICDTRLGGE